MNLKEQIEKMVIEIHEDVYGYLPKHDKGKSKLWFNKFSKAIADRIEIDKDKYLKNLLPRLVSSIKLHKDINTVFSCDSCKSNICNDLADIIRIKDKD